MGDSPGPSVLILGLSAPYTAELSLVFTTHLDLVSGPLAALPKATTLLANDAHAAKAACFYRVVLLSAAPSADHTVRPLVRVILSGIVALVTRMHFAAAGEAKPPVRALVMGARSSVGQRLSSVQPKFLQAPFRSRSRGKCRTMRDGQELHFWYFECELVVALSANIGSHLAPNRDQSGACYRASPARRYKGTGIQSVLIRCRQMK